jgi:anaerobic selenocysteine-containing dehydrogenase
MPTNDPTEFSRRNLLRRAAVGTAAVAAGPILGPPATAADRIAQAAPRDFDFTADSDALQADKVVDSACQFCNCLCRLKVSIRAGRIIDITGEPADPVQAGGFCVKAPMMAQLVYNRLRITRPMKRVAGAKGSPDSKFGPVYWDEALGIIAKKLIGLRDAGEARAIANKTSGRLPRGTGSLVHRFFTMLGSPNDTDVGPVCNDAGGDALAWTFGLPNFTNGYGVDGATGREDLGTSKFFLFFGTNQAETQPVTFAHLLRSREKTGAKLVVVDPRRTPTAHYADQWLSPKPHTDMALVLGVLHHIVTSNLHDAAFCNRWVVGFDELKKHLIDNNYTADWAAGVCDIPVEQILQTATGYATAKPAAIFCNAGISHQVGAFDTYRLIAFLAAITGNVGVPGGGANFMHNTWPGELNLPPIQGKVPFIDSAGLPVGPDWFSTAILDGRPYPLKAVLTCGNPLVASSNTDKVRAAFAKLDFYACTSLFMEENTYYADVILPVCTGLEMETVYMRRDDRGIRWQHQVVPPIGECRPDWKIWIDLAHAMAKVDKKNPPEFWTGNFPADWGDYRKLWATFVAHTPGAGGMSAGRGRPSRRQHAVSGSPVLVRRGRIAGPGQQGQAVPDPQRQDRIVQPRDPAEAGDGGARGAADLFHASGSDRCPSDDPVPPNTGRQPGQHRHRHAGGRSGDQKRRGRPQKFPADGNDRPGQRRSFFRSHPLDPHRQADERDPPGADPPGHRGGGGDQTRGRHQDRIPARIGHRDGVGDRRHPPRHGFRPHRIRPDAGGGRRVHRAAVRAGECADR